MALRHVNQRVGLLNGYNITYHWVDTQVGKIKQSYLSTKTYFVGTQKNCIRLVLRRTAWGSFEHPKQNYVLSDRLENNHNLML